MEKSIKTVNTVSVWHETRDMDMTLQFVGGL